MANMDDDVKQSVKFFDLVVAECFYVSRNLFTDFVGQRNILCTRYPKKCFTRIYRDLYGDAMLVSTWMGTNMADGNQQKNNIC